MKYLLAAMLGAAAGFSLVAAPPDRAIPGAPVPAETDIEKAENLIRDVHKADYVKKKPADLVDFAKKLLREADGTADDPAAKYVLYREARDLAARGGDVPLALEIVDATARAFAVKPIDLSYAALDAAEKARVAPGRAVAEAALVAADEAVRTDDYPTANRLLKVATAAATRGVGVPGLTATVVGRSKEVEAIRKAFEATEGDRKALQANPADPGANARVGRFRCLSKGDWEAGLPLMAKGDDEKLKAAAELELAGLMKGDDKAALGDRWWDLSGGLPAGERAEARVRAYHWYQEAVAESTGLGKIRVERRLVEIEKAEPKVTRAGGWTVIFRSADPAVWNTATNGKDHFAIPLEKVPAGIKYLKLTEMSRKNFVIIELTKDRLGKRSEQDGYGWNGTNANEFNAHHLGIYEADSASKNGPVAIYTLRTVADYSGWGFGHRILADVQGCAWNSEVVEKMVFEIAVKTTPLAAEESKRLLKKRK